MARSTFYYHAKRLHDSDGYDAVRKWIRDIYETNCGRYGYRRVTAQLHNEGIVINHKTVQRLMGQMELKARTKRQKYRSYKGEVGRVAPNVLNRDFHASRPNQKWATDVTQVNIKGDKLYLSPILDLFNGEIVSYTISKAPDLRMATRMLEKAFRARGNLHGIILHSDQGWHYQHLRYQTQTMLKEKGMVQSMSRKGNCLDNAMMENFFGLMKNELLYLHDWNSTSEFENALMDYINYYNNQRIKLRLNGKSPVQYRTLYHDN